MTPAPANVSPAPRHAVGVNRPTRSCGTHPSPAPNHPEKVGHFRSPEVGHFRSPLTLGPEPPQNSASQRLSLSILAKSSPSRCHLTGRCPTSPDNDSLRQMANLDPPSTSLFKRCRGVFQGGGCRAVAHIGAYQAARESGVELVQVAGSSAGSLVATLIGAGASPSISSITLRNCGSSICSTTGGSLQNALSPSPSTNAPLPRLAAGCRQSARSSSSGAGIRLEESRHG